MGSEGRVFFFFNDIQPTIRRLSDFVSFVQNRELRKYYVIVYRGHGNIKWQTTPSLFRNKKLYSSENSILRSLLASQPDSFLDDQSTLEKLARMQHFSLPTRLLDVTWNPLVALYFCVKDEQNSDGDVVVIGVERNDDKFFDSDTASCVANLAYMNPRERNAIRHAPEMNNFDGSLDKVRSFNAKKDVSRLLHFVKSEKPYFLPDIKPSDLKRNFLVRPKLNNRRLVAQNGAFIMFGLQHKSLEENLGNFKIDKIRIEAKYKRPLQKELDLFGFNDQAMFPELESASKYIRSKFG